MFRKFFTIIVALTLCLSAVSFSKVKELKAKVQGSQELFQIDVAAPSVNAVKQAPTLSKVTAAPADGIVLGNTDYEYGWNSGWSRMIQTFNNGKQVHMTWHERDMTVNTAPVNRRAQKYSFYDYATPTAMVQAYPRPKSVGATGFGGIDVIPAGDGAGIAVMVYHTPNFFAIDGGVGTGAFTETAIPTSFAGTGNDPEITCSPDGKTLWYYDTKVRTNYNVAKSVDYGANWTFVDTLLARVPLANGYYGQGSLDNPILCAPNGNLLLVTTISAAEGAGRNGKPIGDAPKDSSDQIGYFLSTNQGVSWKWVSLGYDGQPVVVAAGDTVYALFDNFGQFTASIDDNNKLHVVANGYAFKVFHKDSDGIADSTATQFYTLYKNVTIGSTTLTNWTAVSGLTVGKAAEWDSTYYNRSGNGIGLAYPTVAVDPTGKTVFASWSQPRFTAGKMVLKEQYIQNDLWWNKSVDGGATWGTSAQLANTDGATFIVAAPRLTVSAGVTTAHMIYIKDTIPGCNVSQTSLPTARLGLVPVVYRTLSVVTTGVNDKNLSVEKFELSQNYPNPFNPSTTIQYAVGTPGLVTLSIYNVLGQEVATLVNEVQSAGSHVANFDASKLASGMYLYKIQAGNFTSSKKMMLMK